NESIHRHELLFCSDDATLVEGLTCFLVAALESENPAIVWATDAHRRSLVESMRARGVNVDAAIQRGTLILEDVSEPPDATRISLAIGRLGEAALKSWKKHPRIAICGERAGLLWAAGKTDEAVQLERLCNELAAIHDIDVFCVYPLPQFHENNSSL